MSPRRSSRARSSQQPPLGPNHTTSTSSINPRPDRDTRTNNFAASPRGPSTQRSESADGADSSSRTEQIAPRRSRRNGDDKEQVVKQQADDEENDLEPADEEITRCICGQAEYPGPSPALRQQQPNTDVLTDDTGNFFVQCDKCSVWQHGGCMGLLDESMLPDEYYCEQCKPQYHKITKSANGVKSSRYLPVLETGSSRSSPLSSNPEMGRKKENKNKQSESTKRRATFNSRGAYDEDEMLRRAIEESKEMGTLGKRTRDESEENKGASKRQRTGSNSSGTVSKRSESPDVAVDDPISRSTTNGRTAAQKLRGAAARNNREKELREKAKEQQAAQRAEAASKRNARSERRRADDSPPPTPSLSPSKGGQPNGKTKADTPPSGRSNHNNNRKVGSRPAARRGRLGRNQYTRDQTNGEEGDNTPLRDGSHDINGHDNKSGGSPSGADRKGSGGAAAVHSINGESGRSSKAKTHPARTSLNEMKRRVAAILEFVGRMQTERTTQAQAASQVNGGSGGSSKGSTTPNGVSKTSSTSSSTGSTLPTASLVRAVEAGLKDVKEKDDDHVVSMIDEREFATMGSVDMMETLTRELVQWQSVYGVYSR
ncbi:uncharacterized protein Z520_07372 [Fonsecaea multimorphosa CBS 102226]|uniref:Zinc finger PHD-type domain-containing protein n=1 Tax=Fonsecaea multimorphosa CBS 102226 TaxID=1442371 RepID=A0A0D2KJ62_9EURO|nr:uncharacterized protein Z520_07372 [Fonsecaea multimorphosa CBS 102226]KIX96653.1 hypothetical protein Z520_07372 [Fonsecaea multimorphosa CBS 102226]OAL20735.1 hypothetical protein AYO22_08744 [Fonsecaea multimorphosa]